MRLINNSNMLSKTTYPLPLKNDIHHVSFKLSCNQIDIFSLFCFVFNKMCLFLQKVYKQIDNYYIN